jgi:hypothetical protein
MADKKISALTGAATPLAGSEVLPIVQSGATVKVSVDNLTAGKTVNASGLQIGSIGATGAAFPGRIKLEDGPISLQGPGGLEFVTATFGSGYGWKISSIDSGGVQLVFGYRQNSVNWTESMRLTSDGNLKISTAAKGIDFSANTNAPGMTSEVLNWYEQGTWTPSDGSGAGLGLTVANATYTRIGRLVTANFAITYPATADATDARIDGLPFTSSSVGFSFPMVVSFSQTGICKSGLVDTSATTFLLSDTAGNTLTNAQMSTLILRGTVIYEV